MLKLTRRESKLSNTVLKFSMWQLKLRRKELKVNSRELKLKRKHFIPKIESEGVDFHVERELIFMGGGGAIFMSEALKLSRRGLKLNKTEFKLGERVLKLCSRGFKLSRREFIKKFIQKTEQEGVEFVGCNWVSFGRC